MDKEIQTSSVTQFQSGSSNDEKQFKAIGLACFFDTNEDNNVDWDDLFDVQYFSNPGLLAALKEAEEDIAAGRVREVKDSSQLWEGLL